MERTEEEELRILRRVVSNRQKNELKKMGSIRISSKMGEIYMETFVTITLLEIPPLESESVSEISRWTLVAHEHAQKRCKELGYKQVVTVRFTGKVWEAVFKL